MDLASSPLHANVELKARLRDHDSALLVCGRIGAADQGVMTQVDTYFSMGRYRLKLRESSTGRHWLIGYSRPDGSEARKSQYRIVAVAAPRNVKSTLARQWGVKVVVRKRRHLFLWEERVRIHLDRVDNLGDFLEFEAVLPDLDSDSEPVNDFQPLPVDATYDEDAARLDVARLSHDFGLRPADLVETSYSNLVRAATQTPAGT